MDNTNRDASTRITKNALPDNWALITLFNLIITALIGLAMRYKIVFPFKMMDQGHALHAHANFVFSGWVSLTIFSSITAFVLSEKYALRKVYKRAFYYLQFTAVGMFLSFLFLGYSEFTNFLATLNIIASCIFIINLWRNLKDSNSPKIVRLFLKGAMFWYLLSVPGVLLLLYMNITGFGTPIQIRATFYYFLHFQYNGWFTFAIFGLLLSWLYTIHRELKSNIGFKIFWLLCIGLIPGYFLSILAFYPKPWAEIPSIISVLTYLIAASLLFIVVIKIYPQIRSRMPVSTNVLWTIATLTFFFKTIMQAATLVPSLASFAFSFRPLIIGFLHLTFLCFVTFFLIGYLLYFKQLDIRKSFVTRWGLITFVTMVLASEAILFIQSLFAFMGSYSAIYNKLIFWITAVMFLSLVAFFLGQFKKKEEPEVHGV